MSFIADKQTLDDLNILGKYKPGSVYGLFNRTKTRGGERLLEDMFRNPLGEAQAINQRSGVFRYFQDKKLSLPFDKEQFSKAEEYLNMQGPGTLLTATTDTLKKKWLALLVRDERYEKQVAGLAAAVKVLHSCSTFLGLLDDNGSENPYREEIKQIRTIFNDGRLSGILKEKVPESLPVLQVAKYDYFLKHKLHDEMEKVLSFIYALDVYIAVSEAARLNNFTYARALPRDAGKLCAVGLRHPCLERAMGNSLSLQKNSNLLFLTGANMAGKSTLMKSVGIAVYLAHIGFPVAAEDMEFSLRDGLYSSINVPDNISLGYSHFYAEVLRVKQAAEAVSAGQHLVVMFDELFKGTNVKDAYDGTLAVTEAFAEYEECLFVISTHIIEVGKALSGTSNIQFGYMPTVMDGAHPRYTYHLTEGITEDRQGMLIIENEGILEMIRS